MVPQQGQYVKCFFRNTTQIEGYVIEWLEKQITLKSSDESYLIIHKPLEDLMLTKIIAAPTSAIKQESEHKQEIRDKLKETQQIDDPELQTKSVKELRDLALAQEKQMIADKIRQHYSELSGRGSNYASQIDLLGKTQ